MLALEEISGIDLCEIAERGRGVRGRGGQEKGGEESFSYPWRIAVEPVGCAVEPVG